MDNKNTINEDSPQSESFTSSNLNPTVPPASPSVLAIPPTPVKKRLSKKLIIAIVVAVIVLVGGIAAWALTNKDKTADGSKTTANTNPKTTLVFAVHYLEDYQMNGIKKDGKVVKKGLNQYLDEYNSSQSGVKVVAQQIEYNKYADQLKVLADGGAAPDIYQIYSPWGASYVRSNLLDEPSSEVQADIKSNYVSYAGATINDKIWGYPTEVDNYALLYNKELFKAAGLVDSKGEALMPKTWQDVQNYAQKLTRKDAKGNITQYGIAFTKDNDWQVVDPFLSLLFSNGGSYLSGDNKRALFNSTAGVSALDAQLQLFKSGTTDINGNFFDFGKGKVGMVVSPPWPKSTFAENFGDKFSATVGVAPFPYMTKPASLQYSWFTGVMAGSQNKAEAWKFLKWFEAESQASGTTRLGDLLANTIGAIPARNNDFNSHKDVLGDFFTGTYVKQMPTSTAEPNVLQASQIKAALMNEIQAAWIGQKTSKQALDSAAEAVNKLLASQN